MQTDWANRTPAHGPRPLATHSSPPFAPAGVGAVQLPPPRQPSLPYCHHRTLHRLDSHALVLVLALALAFAVALGALGLLERGAQVRHGLRDATGEARGVRGLGALARGHVEEAFLVRGHHVAHAVPIVRHRPEAAACRDALGMLRVPHRPPVRLLLRLLGGGQAPRLRDDLLQERALDALSHRHHVQREQVPVHAPPAHAVAVLVLVRARRHAQQPRALRHRARAVQHGPHERGRLGCARTDRLRAAQLVQARHGALVRVREAAGVAVVGQLHGQLDERVRGHAQRLHGALAERVVHDDVKVEVADQRLRLLHRRLQLRRRLPGQRPRQPLRSRQVRGADAPGGHVLPARRGHGRRRAIIIAVAVAAAATAATAARARGVVRAGRLVRERGGHHRRRLLRRAARARAVAVAVVATLVVLAGQTGVLPQVPQHRRVRPRVLSVEPRPAVAEDDQLHTLVEPAVAAVPMHEQAPLLRHICRRLLVQTHHEQRALHQVQRHLVHALAQVALARLRPHRAVHGRPRRHGGGGRGLALGVLQDPSKLLLKLPRLQQRLVQALHRERVQVPAADDGHVLALRWVPVTQRVALAARQTGGREHAPVLVHAQRHQAVDHDGLHALRVQQPLEVEEEARERGRTRGLVGGGLDAQRVAAVVVAVDHDGAAAAQVDVLLPPVRHVVGAQRVLEPKVALQRRALLGQEADGQRLQLLVLLLRGAPAHRVHVAAHRLRQGRQRQRRQRRLEAVRQRPAASEQLDCEAPHLDRQGRLAPRRVHPTAVGQQSAQEGAMQQNDQEEARHDRPEGHDGDLLIAPDAIMPREHAGHVPHEHGDRADAPPGRVVSGQNDVHEDGQQHPERRRAQREESVDQPALHTVHAHPEHAPQHLGRRDGEPQFHVQPLLVHGQLRAPLQL
mmetsp:Transcript_8784/g.27719  ORF Transcript_8784/g.27719 Transcript_8784/m.27719 type:complete len:907 (-) Transcript_8784:99-2819(-)